jgi:signal transduction histidine kinase
LTPDLPDVLVDRDKFGQVIVNLLNNAVKYSPNGGCITLSAYNDLQRHRVVVSVVDEGIGISPEDKDLLFTTFHRIQRPETRGIRGSGLGLYIAKEWIEAMGGEIWLESELNKGSTFFIAILTKDSSETAKYYSGKDHD